MTDLRNGGVQTHHFIFFNDYFLTMLQKKDTLGNGIMKKIQCFKDTRTILLALVVVFQSDNVAFIELAH